MITYTEAFTDPTQRRFTQGGVRVGRDTLQQCYALHEIMVRNEEAIDVFLDLTAAYDCVNHGVLSREMAAYGSLDHSMSFAGRLFYKNAFNLVVNGSSSGDIWYSGLLQGSSLSPLLFHVYDNSLWFGLTSC